MTIDFKYIMEQLEKIPLLEAKIAELEVENEKLREHLHPTPEWITIKEGAKLIGVDVSTIHRYAKCGDLKKYRSPSGSPRLKRSELLLFYSRKSL